MANFSQNVNKKKTESHKFSGFSAIKKSVTGVEGGAV